MTGRIFGVRLEARPLLQAPSVLKKAPLRMREAGLFGWVSLCLVIVVERKWKFVNEITNRHAQNHLLQLTVSLKPSGA
jgi:hypothetical protein